MWDVLLWFLPWNLPCYHIVAKYHVIPLLQQKIYLEIIILFQKPAGIMISTKRQPHKQAGHNVQPGLTSTIAVSALLLFCSVNYRPWSLDSTSRFLSILNFYLPIVISFGLIIYDNRKGLRLHASWLNKQGQETHKCKQSTACFPPLSIPVEYSFQLFSVLMTYNTLAGLPRIITFLFLGTITDMLIWSLWWTRRTDRSVQAGDTGYQHTERQLIVMAKPLSRDRYNQSRPEGHIEVPFRAASFFVHGICLFLVCTLAYSLKCEPTLVEKGNIILFHITLFTTQSSLPLKAQFFI